MLKCCLVLLSARRGCALLEKPHAGMSYSAAGREFTVSQSTIYIKQGVFKHKHIKQGYVLNG